LFPSVALDSGELAVDPLGPGAEVVNLAANFLHPLARDVRREGEVGVGFLWTASRPRSGIGGSFTRTAIRRRINGHGVTSVAKGLRWRRLRRVTAAGGNFSYPLLYR